MHIAQASTLPTFTTALQLQHPLMHTWDVAQLQRLDLGGGKALLTSYDGLRLSGSLIKIRPVRRGSDGEAGQEVIM